mmetsp:Transcript_58168/g.170083  ORF Transcript_58168/g.170083 Transcript_58168/m.170083 type:complete len:91 (+) Transcript_58168:2-274(+)
MFCEPTQEECSYQVQFSKDAQILQWSWFGKQPKYPFTFEGMVIFSILMSFILMPVVLSSKCAQQWFGVKKQQLRSVMALNSAVCKHAVRS